MNKPFTVVWKNPDTPIASTGTDLVKCGVCNKDIHPLDAFGFYEISLGNDYRGYEYNFFVCSKACDGKKEGAINKIKSQNK